MKSEQPSRRDAVGKATEFGDVMLAQKIALENDGQSALAVARSLHPLHVLKQELDRLTDQR